MYYDPRKKTTMYRLPLGLRQGANITLDNTESGSVGAVARDDMGRFMAACNERVVYAIDAATTEAMAVTWTSIGK